MKKVKLIPVKWINENHDTDYDGTPNYLDCEPFNPHRQDHVTMNIKVYPNATIEEVRKKAVEYKEKVPFTDAKSTKKYRKGEFMYSVIDGEVTALYMPSYHKKLKIMFEWNSKKKKWELLTYREGDW